MSENKEKSTKPKPKPPKPNPKIRNIVRKSLDDGD